MIHACSEIMTKELECCLPKTTADEIARIMDKNNIGPVPVVEDKQNKKVLGIITDRDLAIKVIGANRDPKQTKAKDIMTKEVVSCGSNESIEDALTLMEENQIRRMLVVDENQKLVGIISQSDIANRLKVPNLTAKVVEAVSRPGL